MRVESGAGEFVIAISEVCPRGNALVLRGSMGIWQADTIISPREMLHLVRLSLHWRVLWYLVRLPWLALKEGKG
ncbi:MAG: hypothetical protein ACK4K2_01685 [Dehalococcoidia bacterium]